MADEEVKVFLRVDGAEHGPLSAEEVKSWIDEGRFRSTDYIRVAGKKAWVRAENVVHLKALFDEAHEKKARGGFAAWVESVRTGKTPIALTTVGRAAEQERIDSERAVLSEEREKLEAEEKELREKLAQAVAEREEELRRLEAEREHERQQLEAERDEEVRRLAAQREEEVARLIAEREEAARRAAEEQEREMARLAEERARLDTERERLADEERELESMGKTLWRRRRLPIFAAIGVVVVAALIGGPLYYFNIYKPGRELSEKLSRISDLETRIGALTNQLEEALKTGDTAKAQEISKEIEKARVEKEKLAGEVPEKYQPKMSTSRGKAKLAGLLRAEGAGAEDPARSGGAITAGLSGGLGGVRSTYSRELGKNPGLEGHVIVSIKVSADGAVTNAHVVSSTIGNSAVESAVTGAARGARFGPAAGETALTYKFDFSP